MDRALVVQAYRQRGFASRDIAELMGLKERQLRYIQQLLQLPAIAQEAIGDPNQHFGATHGVALKGLLKRYPDLDWATWIAACNKDALSVVQLERAVKTNLVEVTIRSPFESLFHTSQTDLEHNVVRFRTSRLVLEEMATGEIQALLAELEALQQAALRVLNGVVH